MSDGLFDLDEYRPPSAEDAEDLQFGTVRPSKRKAYDEITENLEASHAYAEVAVKENAKEALEELYHSEFPIDDPPESFERYEAEMAVRALRNSVEDLAHIEGDTTVLVADLSDDAGIEDPVISEVPDPDRRYGEAVTQNRIEIAKSSIDVMKTYGDLAEPHIAALSRRDLPSEVREYAVETLAQMRDDSTESLSLREAFGRWLLR